MNREIEITIRMTIMKINKNHGNENYENDNQIQWVAIGRWMTREPNFRYGRSSTSSHDM